eukprot:m.132915 g.132915  ORF g.132915 m.132915 type:complete len:59 (+) comp13816_c0_seq3:1768-1944(+)
MKGPVQSLDINRNPNQVWIIPVNCPRIFLLLPPSPYNVLSGLHPMIIKPNHLQLAFQS